MNLKIIIKLPEKVKSFLDDTANDLYDEFKGKYFSKDEFWITLRDINKIDDFGLKQIKAALYSISSKSDPFTLYLGELKLMNPRKKSSLVYTLRGLTSKLYNLDQNIENALYTRQIERESGEQSPQIEIAQKVFYRQLPYVRTPDIPIEVGSIVVMETKQTFSKTKYEVLEEYPLFGGQLIVTNVKDDKVTCENSFEKIITLNIMEMPLNIKEKDVIIKTGAQYTVDINETRVRAIQEQIKTEKLINAKK